MEVVDHGEQDWLRAKIAIIPGAFLPEAKANVTGTPPNRELVEQWTLFGDQTLFHAKAIRSLHRKQELIHSGSVGDWVRNQVNMLRHEDERGEPPAMSFHRTIECNAQLLSSPVVSQQGPTLITAKSDLV